MVRWFSLALLGIVAFTGCVATDRYKACLGDKACYEEMEAARITSYNAVKSASNVPGIPSFPEVLALLVSNLAAFGVGVLRGKKVNQKGG